MSGSHNKQFPEGDLPSDLGPIGQAALDASNAELGYVSAPVRTDPTDPTGAFEDGWLKVEAWMRRTFEADLIRMKEKAQLYGSHDLEIMATSMEALLPHATFIDAASRHAAAMEMAIGFYLMGKASRLFGAWQRGLEPDIDSWRDSEIYSLMARYIRENGRWV